MKILFLHHHVRGGGVTRVLAAQIRALQGRSSTEPCQCRLSAADAQPPRDFDGLSFDYQSLAELDYLATEIGPQDWQRIEQTLYAHLSQAAKQG